jgi:heme exporter protein D
MDFTSFKSFLLMGGYAIYIWPAYFFVLTLMGINFLIPVFRLKKLKEQLKEQSDSTVEPIVDAETFSSLESPETL